MTDYEAAKATLLGSRQNPADIPPVHLPGLYAPFVVEPDSLPGIAVPASGLLYIGMTESSLAIRHHFTQPASGFSTLRRTLGALLKSELRLRAIPRATGPSKTNTTNYRFTEGGGERELTKWMGRYLAYSYATIHDELSAYERRLIEELEPPLNLTGWRNPQRRQLMDLRTACRNEARQAAGP